MATFGDVTVFRRFGAEGFDGGGASLDVLALTAGELDLQSLRFRAGAAVILPGAARWSAVPSADATLVHYRVSGALMARLRPFEPVTPSRLNAPAFVHVLSRLDAEVRRNDVASALAIEALLCELFAHARRVRSNARVLSAEVAAALHHAVAHLAAPLTLGALAAAAGVSERHLSARFAAELHNAPMQHVRALRMRFAARALRATNASLGDVAARAGFYDHAHFTRTFRRTYGMTPSDYRHAAVTPDRTNAAVAS